MRWIVSILIIACLFTSGCAILSAKGEKVELTAEAARVKDCRRLGEVRATPPYGLPTDWKKQLRNRAGEMGGNVVYAESPGLFQSIIPGAAYDCPK